ncbi:MAG TPA: hypothetical protein VJZ77_09320 [Blastocatellia bacterium]|nr:hypothetical protein [Blastocatellia bacterium]
MSKPVDSVRAITSLSRVPIEREKPEGVTIDEIERRILELLPGASLNARRSFSMLFAILKQGASVQKLQWFTTYDLDFVRERVEALRSQGLLFTGTLSTQYVLSQVPGSEGLIERITGQRIAARPVTAPPAPLGDWQKNLVKPPAASSSTPRPAAKPINRNREEKPMPIETVNGAAADAVGVQSTCLKTPGCPRPAGHNGICKGQKVNRRRLSTDPPEVQRAANAERMRLARAEDKSSGRPPKAGPAKAVKAARNSRKPQPVDALTATATALIDPGYFKIEFEDGQDTISREGHGREGFARALKALHQEFAGGSNG